MKILEIKIPDKIVYFILVTHVNLTELLCKLTEKYLINTMTI